MADWLVQFLTCVAFNFKRDLEIVVHRADHFHFNAVRIREIRKRPEFMQGDGKFVEYQNVVFLQEGRDGRQNEQSR